jgi:tRNA nucleotidyltransferase (CCA-adding enzyme)
MAAAAPDRVPLALPELPFAVRAVLDRLAAAGFEAFLVGRCLREALRGERPRDFGVATGAPLERTLALFPSAVPIGRRFGTAMLPTRAGPVDVTRFRAGRSIEDDLAHRDLTIDAMAWDPRRAELVDPFDGRADLAKGRLRAVGSADERLAEDPLRALRAARLQAELGFEVDPALEAALGRARGGLAQVARERVRSELARLLLGPEVGAALSLLRRTGLEEDLAPGALPDAARVVAALPADLELRLAAWLRGGAAAEALRRLYFGRAASQRVLRLVELHPLEAQAHPGSEPALRRLLRRAGDRELRGLLALRRAELAGAAPAEAEAAGRALEALEAALARLRRGRELASRRGSLALGGAEVMGILGCGPGPLVGRALRYLAERVAEDPEQNQPAALRTWLARFAAESGAAGARGEG